jgi:hypothetical protein
VKWRRPHYQVVEVAGIRRARRDGHRQQLPMDAGSRSLGRQAAARAPRLLPTVMRRRELLPARAPPARRVRRLAPP